MFKELSEKIGLKTSIYFNEGGSSGSPAFNTNGLLIGQLTGGSGSCSNDSGQDYYGKFSRSFSDVSQWLDPSNTGASYIEGIYEAMTDTDGDGVDDNADSNATDPYQCSDIDQDTCDDCSSGTFDSSDDGWDYDNDGINDNIDIDNDNLGDECDLCDNLNNFVIRYEIVFTSQPYGSVGKVETTVQIHDNSYNKVNNYDK